MTEVLVALIGGLGLVVTSTIGVWATVRSQGTKLEKRSVDRSDIHATQAARIENKIEKLREEVEAHVQWEEDPDPALGKYAEIEALLLELNDALKRQ